MFDQAQLAVRCTSNRSARYPYLLDHELTSLKERVRLLQRPTACTSGGWWFEPTRGRRFRIL